MAHIEDLKAGERITGTYLVKSKQQALTKIGAIYWNVTLQDKTGIINAKVWDPTHTDITPFENFDVITVTGEVSSFNDNLQINIRSNTIVDKSKINLIDYLPATKYDIDEMYAELLTYIDKVENTYLSSLLKQFFYQGNSEFIGIFKASSAAKSVHHAFIGGLLEHTLNVTRTCDFLADQYDFVNKDLLLTAAICHDIGKTKELTLFPENDFSDEGSLIGHLVLGMEMVTNIINRIPDFPETLAAELRHCILAHHGQLEFGSPKRPAIVEAMLLNMTDNMDANVAIFNNALKVTTDENPWAGYDRFLETNVRRTIGYLK